MEANGQEQESVGFEKYLNRQSDWLEKTKGNLMVTATVLAGLNFQVMVSPPGGVWQGEACSFQTQTCTAGIAGTSVLEHVRYNGKEGSYLVLVLCCAMSFSASMSLILLVLSGLKLRNRVIMAILAMLMLVAVFCTSIAFYCVVDLVQFNNKAIQEILDKYIIYWICFPLLIFLIQVVRGIWKLICLCCCKRRRRSHQRMLPQAAAPAH